MYHKSLLFVFYDKKYISTVRTLLVFATDFADFGLHIERGLILRHKLLKVDLKIHI